MSGTSVGRKGGRREGRGWLVLPLTLLILDRHSGGSGGKGGVHRILAGTLTRLYLYLHLHLHGDG